MLLVLDTLFVDPMTVVVNNQNNYVDTLDKDTDLFVVELLVGVLAMVAHGIPAAVVVVIDVVVEEIETTVVEIGETVVLIEMTLFQMILFPKKMELDFVIYYLMDY